MDAGFDLGAHSRFLMDTDLHIPVTSEEKQLMQEAMAEGPEGLAAWARDVLLQAAREQLARRESFGQLAEQWRRETGMHSSITRKVQHPAYQQIIAMGEPVLPLILRELRDRPGYWFEALRTITKQSPVEPAERADPAKARAAWLKWGREKGLID
jgi:hypothetical protein